MSERLTRIAVINDQKCKPNKCKQECKKKCPVVQNGQKCIEVNTSSKLAFISEELCTGCNACVKACPFDAISIINIPKSLDIDKIHRYSANSFKLHRLPVPRLGQILGIVGSNALGKSSLVKILA
jgi:ATP-binding cassette subfamily E protein 1